MSVLRRIQAGAEDLPIVAFLVMVMASPGAWKDAHAGVLQVAVDPPRSSVSATLSTSLASDTQPVEVSGTIQINVGLSSDGQTADSIRFVGGSLSTSDEIFLLNANGTTLSATSVNLLGSLSSAELAMTSSTGSVSQFDIGGVTGQLSNGTVAANGDILGAPVAAQADLAQKSPSSDIPDGLMGQVEIEDLAGDGFGVTLTLPAALSFLVLEDPIATTLNLTGQVVLTGAASDNCSSVGNPAQTDTDGDGIGNACECGDFDLSGRVNTTDARLIQRCAVGQIPCLNLCDVTGEGTCNTTDARLIQRLAVGQLTKENLSCAERP